MWYFLTDNFQPRAGYHTDMYNHNNIMRQRLVAIMKGVLDGVNGTTIIEYCRVNGNKILSTDIVDQICPIMFDNKTSDFNITSCSKLGNDGKTVLTRILEITKKIKEKVGLDIVMGLIDDMNQNGLKYHKIKHRLIPIMTILVKEGIPLENLKQCILSKNNWRGILSLCQPVDIKLECEDTTKDFCVRGEIGFGSVVIAAVFLPGFIQAVGNMIFHKVSCLT